MKKYTINVHYDMVVSVAVEAESKEEATRLAYVKAGNALPDEMECMGINSCITDIEKL